MRPDAELQVRIGPRSGCSVGGARLVGGSPRRLAIEKTIAVQVVAAVSTAETDRALQQQLMALREGLPVVEAELGPAIPQVSGPPHDEVRVHRRIARGDQIRGLAREQTEALPVERQPDVAHADLVTRIRGRKSVEVHLHAAARLRTTQALDRRTLEIETEPRQPRVEREAALIVRETRFRSHVADHLRVIRARVIVHGVEPHEAVGLELETGVRRVRSGRAAKSIGGLQLLHALLETLDLTNRVLERLDRPGACGQPEREPGDQAAARAGAKRGRHQIPPRSGRDLATEERACELRSRASPKLQPTLPSSQREAQLT
jgi:hypothetical protein